MSWWEAVLILLGGTAAGAINAVVGSGTLITFPVLVALGFAPLTANVSNNIGLVPGGFSGAWGYRHELGGQYRTLVRLVPCSAVGGVAGALLLLVLPPGAFSAIVPVLIAIALVMVVLQPRLARRMRASGGARQGWPASRAVGLGLMLGVLASGVYGGYFGAAQGVLMLGLLGWLLTDDLQTANGIKNVLTPVVNALAALTFLIAAPSRVNWVIVLLIAVGSTAGGFIGASLGRRAPAPVLRGIIVVVGLVAIVRLVLT